MICLHHLLRCFLSILNIHEVENASCYAILGDEVKDASKKELLGASLRYVHKADVRERDIGFIELKDMDAGMNFLLCSYVPGCN